MAAAATEEDKSPLNSTDNDGQCVICCEDIKIFAVGACDHPICYKCSARMRVLSKQTYCATCRAEMKEVVVSFQEKKFSEFQLAKLKAKQQYGFFFEEWRLLDKFDSLFENTCMLCGIKEKPFLSLEDLRNHIRKVHEKQFCLICVDTLSNFPKELKMYTKKEMVTHRKDGDRDDRSHRGHPECKFCSDRFFDNDTLLLHLRKSHFWCHFCEHDGKQEYYNIYKDLRKHFGDTHYLCDEGACVDEKYTSVFRDKIDYQAHKLASHGKNLNKIQAKEARKVDLEYTDYRYKKRQGPSCVVITSDLLGENSKASRSDANRRDYPANRKPETKEDCNGFDKLNMETCVSDVSPESMENDVIGLAEYKNKPVFDRNAKAGAQTIPPKKDNINFLKEKSNISTNQNNFNNFSEEFPLLPGGVAVPVSSVNDGQQEDFPALVSVRSKSQKETPFVDKKGFEHDMRKKVKQNNASPPVAVKTKEKGKSWTHQSGRAYLTTETAFPSLLSTNVNEKSCKGNRKENKPVETLLQQPRKAQNTKKEQTLMNTCPIKTYSTNAKVPPGLGINGTRKKENAPPGFKSPSVNAKKEQTVMNGLSKTYPNNTRQPPGLGINGTCKKETALPNNTRQPPGLGINGTCKKETAPPGFKTSSVDTVEGNTKERSLQLVAMLQIYLDEFNFQIFKNISGEFRKDLRTAAVYYSDISELLGDGLKCVFSELVALLPDEKKREELLKLHKNAKVLAKEESLNKPNNGIYKKAVWGAPSTSLQETTSSCNEIMTQCVDCGMTIPRDKALEHMESHSEAFPSLPTTIKKKYNAPFSRVEQYQVRNHWTK